MSSTKDGVESGVLLQFLINVQSSLSSNLFFVVSETCSQMLAVEKTFSLVMVGCFAGC